MLQEVLEDPQGPKDGKVFVTPFMIVQGVKNLKVSLNTDQPTNRLTGIGASDDYISKIRV